MSDAMALIACEFDMVPVVSRDTGEGYYNRFCSQLGLAELSGRELECD